MYSISKKMVHIGPQNAWQRQINTLMRGWTLGIVMYGVSFGAQMRGPLQSIALNLNILSVIFYKKTLNL